MPESSCPKYIAPGSREARELEATRADKGKPIDSDWIDRMLMAETIADLESRRRIAIQATQACLSAAKAGAPRTASRYAERALKALGGLGAS
jgi:alkylation response protein AidB-like acyl-CoA dehydrogenase